jgi:hypothetical protein
MMLTLTGSALAATPEGADHEARRTNLANLIVRRIRCPYAPFWKHIFACLLTPDALSLAALRINGLAIAGFPRALLTHCSQH